MSEHSIFITGGAAGIGRATAQHFAGRGWNVGVFDIDAKAAEAVAKELGPRAIWGALDVTEPGEWEDALRTFEVAFGRMDLLLNNAGVASVGDFEDFTPERYRVIIDVNLQGVINGCLAALPLLKATGSARVINMASASAIYGSPSFAVYSATKFAVRGFTEALNIEWRRHGIVVMDLLPLFVSTEMVENFEIRPEATRKLGVKLKPEGVANEIWRAAHRPAALCPGTLVSRRADARDGDRPEGRPSVGEPAGRTDAVGVLIG